VETASAKCVIQQLLEDPTFLTELRLPQVTRSSSHTRCRNLQLVGLLTKQKLALLAGDHLN